MANSIKKPKSYSIENQTKHFVLNMKNQASSLLKKNGTSKEHQQW
jgi:hypothetical protein